MPGANTNNLRARKAEAGIDRNPIGNQIGMGRITNDDIGQALSLQPQIGNPVSRLHMPRRKFLIDNIGGDRPSLRPDQQHGKRQCRQADKTPAPSAYRFS